MLNNKKKLDRDQLKLFPPTAQVRMLCCEVFEDGKHHSRKDVLDYVNKKGVEFGFGTYRDGCLSAGFTEAVNMMNCIRLGSGIYQVDSQLDINDDIDNTVQISKYQEIAAELCDECIDKLTELSREIDYVNADTKEIDLLELLRNCVIDLKKWQSNFQKPIN